MNGTTDEQANAKNQAEQEEQWALMDAAERSRELPFRFANRVYVSPDGLNIRITFGELIAGEVVYHTAIIMPNTEAYETSQLLERISKESLDNQIATLREMADYLEAAATQNGQEKDV